jgi:RND superfamily putative drug exporter
VLRRIARFCFRRRWTVIALWIAALVGLGALSGALGETKHAGFEIPSSESREVLDMLKEVSPDQAGTDGQIVFQSATGVNDPQVKGEITAMLDEVAQLRDVQVTSPFSPQGAGQISQDGTVAFARLQFPEFEGQQQPQVGKDIERLRDQVADPDLRIELGGDVFTKFHPPSSELLGIAAAVFILLLAFGSVLAVGLPIGVALAGIGTGVALIGIAAHLFKMPEFTTTLALMIGLGVGIDYALFIVTRYREGIHAGDDPQDATVTAIDTAGRSVGFAGTIVIISLLGMLLMGVSFINGLAVGAALAVLTTMIASLTLLPALLSFVRRRIDFTTWSAVTALVIVNLGLLVVALGAPGPILVACIVLAMGVVVAGRFVRPLRQQAPIHQPNDSESNLWHRWSRTIQRHPWRALIGGLTALLVLALPLFGMRLGNSDNGNLPKEQTARRAYDLMADAFGPGFNGPLLLALRVPEGTTQQQLDAATQKIAATEGVQFASPAQVVPGHDVAIWQVVPTTGPQDEATNHLIDRLRDDVVPTTGLPIKVGGMTAIFADFSTYLASRLPIFMGAVLILSFLLLMAVFRSVLVPLKAVVLNLLSIGAAYGVVTAVFQWGWGASLIGVGKGGPIESFMPMMLFAIVFGLSMDYEVFLLSRMKEEYDDHGDNAVAVANGLAVTARVITSAAAIMVCVFGSFLLEDMRQIKLFGLGLAVAVFIDATIVRMLLVPATMELLGDRNWWLPKWLDKVLPHISVEGQDAHRHHGEPAVNEEPEERELVGAGRE